MNSNNVAKYQFSQDNTAHVLFVDNYLLNSEFVDVTVIGLNLSFSILPLLYLPKN